MGVETLKLRGITARAAFTPSEDALLLHALRRFGPNDWSNVSLWLLPGKQPKQVAVRFKNRVAKGAGDNALKQYHIEQASRPSQPTALELLRDEYLILHELLRGRHTATKLTKSHFEQIVSDYFPHRSKACVRLECCSPQSHLCDLTQMCTVRSFIEHGRSWRQSESAPTRLRRKALPHSLEVEIWSSWPTLR